MRLLMLVAAAAIFVSCGYSPCACDGGGTLPVQTSPSPGLGFDVTATEKDKAVSMHVGQKLQLVLNGGGQINWQQLKSSDTSILEPTVHPAATAARGVTLAAFKALAAGQVQVTAVGTAACPSGQPCPMFAVLYSLAVTVT